MMIPTLDAADEETGDKTASQMRELQLRQVLTLKQHLALPGDRGRHAAICLAHLVKPDNSLVRNEALDTLLAALKPDNAPDARTRAAWALGGLANWVSPYELSERIVPALIEALGIKDAGRPDVRVAGQAYHSLLYIGTPDAIDATETYRARVIAAKRQED